MIFCKELNWYWSTRIWFEQRWHCPHEISCPPNVWVVFSRSGSLTWHNNLQPGGWPSHRIHDSLIVSGALAHLSLSITEPNADIRTFWVCSSIVSLQAIGVAYFRYRRDMYFAHIYYGGRSLFVHIRSVNNFAYPYLLPSRMPAHMSLVLIFQATILEYCVVSHYHCLLFLHGRPGSYRVL